MTIDRGVTKFEPLSLHSSDTALAGIVAAGSFLGQIDYQFSKLGEYLTQPTAYWQYLLAAVFAARGVGANATFANPEIILRDHTNNLVNAGHQSAITISRLIHAGEVILSDALAQKRLNHNGKIIPIESQYQLQILAALYAQILYGDYRIVKGYPTTNEINSARTLSWQIAGEELDHVQSENGKGPVEAKANHIEKTLSSIITILKDPDLGPGGKVDISELIIYKLQQFEEQIANRPAAIQRVYIVKLERVFTEVLVKRSAPIQVLQLLTTLVNRSLQEDTRANLTEGYKLLLAQQVEQRPKTTIRNYLAIISDPTIGIRGRYSIAEGAHKRFDLALDELVLQPWSSQDEKQVWGRQELFLNEMITQFFEAINKAGDNVTLSRQLFMDLEFTLFDDRSAIVIMAKKAEEEGEARVRKTLFKIQQKFLRALAKTENSKVLGELGQAIAANHKARTPEQMARYELHMFNARIAALRGNPNAKEMGQIIRSWTAGTEHLVKRVSEKREGQYDKTSLRALLMSMHIVSPAAYADLAMQSGAFEALHKTTRYHEGRVEAARQKANSYSGKGIDAIDLLNLTSRAGKLDPTRYPFPIDSTVKAHFGSVFSGELFTKVIGDIDRFDALGDQPPGFSHWFAETKNQGKQAIQGEAIRALAIKTFALLEDPSYVKENQQLCAGLLFYWVSALRNIADDSESLKNMSMANQGDRAVSIRQRIVKILINIYIDPDQYGREMQQTVDWLIRNRLIYWPVEDQANFLNSFASFGVYKRSDILPKLPELAKAMAVADDMAMPRLPGEVRENFGLPSEDSEFVLATANIGIRRSIARHAVQAMIWTLRAHQLADGRADRHPLIPRLLVSNTASYDDAVKALENGETLELNKKHLAIQTVNAVSFIGDGEGKEITNCIEALVMLLEVDAIRAQLSISPPPPDVSRAVKTIEVLKKRLAIQAEKATQSYRNLINQMILLMDANIVKGRGPRIVNLALSEKAKQLVSQIGSAAETKYLELGKAHPTVGTLTETVTPDSLEQAFALLSASLMGQTELPNRAALRAISEMFTNVQKSETPSIPLSEANHNGTAIAVSSGGFLPYGGGFLMNDLRIIEPLLKAVQQGEGAKAVAEIIAQLAQYNLSQRADNVEMMAQTGDLRTAQKLNDLRQVIIQAAETIFSGDVDQQKLFALLRSTLNERQADLINQQMALRTAIEEAKTDLADASMATYAQEAYEALEEMQDLLQTKLDTLSDIRETYLPAFREAMGGIASQMLSLEQTANKLTVNDMKRTIEYWIAQTDPDEGVLALLNILQQKLNLILYDLPGLTEPITLSALDPNALAKEFKPAKLAVARRKKAKAIQSQTAS